MHCSICGVRYSTCDLCSSTRMSAYTHTQCAPTPTAQCMPLSLVPQLVYCLHHFKGDEKARPFIHKLIDPSEPGPGKPDGEGGRSWWMCGKSVAFLSPVGILVHILLKGFCTLERDPCCCCSCLALSCDVISALC